MNLRHATIASLIIHDLTVKPISLEAVVRPGLPQFRITGMAAGAARDTAERLRSVAHAQGIRLPAVSVLLHLGPGDLPKRGAYLDLGLFATLLLALDVATPDTLLADCGLTPTLFLGEATLDGTLRASRPLLPLLVEAARFGFRRIVLPMAHEAEARLATIECIGIRSVADLFRPTPEPVRRSAPVCAPAQPWSGPIPSGNPLRGILAAAAGAHPLLMVGPPGTGKTTAASLLHALLPPWRTEELVETLALTALLVDRPMSDIFEPGTATQSLGRPLRLPHHTVTLAGLIGGCRPPQPGEVTLAHGGLLFIDEIGEVQRETLQSLREPLETGLVHLARGGAASTTLPARFWFAAAGNPCPCGYFGSLDRCTCSVAARRSYATRLQGPLEDRMDLHLRFDSGPPEGATGVTFQELVSVVARAERSQRERYAGSGIRRNGELQGNQVDEFASLSKAVRRYWEEKEAIYNGRARAGIRRLARTLADLSGVAEVRTVDLDEAAFLRNPKKHARGGE